MEGLEGIVEDTKDIIEVATKYYKNMFKIEARPEIHIAQDVFFSNDEKVSSEENEVLEAPFSEMEVKKVVFGSYSEGGSVPDGMSFLFYQNF
jgi:hypothetical protein